MKLFLAPMEGVVDGITRDLLTRIGAIDQCVTEFIRVTDQLVPQKVFLREMPELRSGSKTAAGTPVFVQLLGGDPVCLAENAAFASELGACGVDLNFGCPAKTVNRHDGGATLLQFPERIHRIVEAVRKAVPLHRPVTAKIRLGFADPSFCLVNAQAAEAGGASWLTVHCRTKMDLYRPPAFWEWIPRIKEKVRLPIVANGEILSLADFERCRQITGCDQFMMGRGVFRDPLLFVKIRAFYRQEKFQIPSLATNAKFGVAEPFDEWDWTLQILRDFFEINWNQVSPYFAQARTKQWFRTCAEASAPGRALFDELKTITKPELFRERLLRGTERYDGPDDARGIEKAACTGDQNSNPQPHSPAIHS